jgi:hypothetical protein
MRVVVHRKLVEQAFGTSGGLEAHTYLILVAGFVVIGKVIDVGIML